MSFLPHQVPFTLLLYANTEKRQHKIKNETTKSNNTYKIVQIFKKYCIESYKLCGNPPKKAVFPTIKRELKKRCTPPNQGISFEKERVKKERVFLFGMLSLIYLMNK